MTGRVALIVYIDRSDVSEDRKQDLKAESVALST